MVLHESEIYQVRAVRPTSLMNVVMKILIKVLAKKLEGVMNLLVSDTHSAFIKVEKFQIAS